jgi:integrase
VNIGRNSKGKYIRRTKTINCRTKREAESEYWKFRQEVEVGEYISPQKMTFGAFVEEWYSIDAIKHLGHKTLYTCDTYLKNRILPHFKDLRLEDSNHFTS